MADGSATVEDQKGQLSDCCPTAKELTNLEQDLAKPKEEMGQRGRKQSRFRRPRSM
jgi:hypothetical protein